MKLLSVSSLVTMCVLVPRRLEMKGRSHQVCLSCDSLLSFHRSCLMNERLWLWLVSGTMLLRFFLPDYPDNFPSILLSSLSALRPRLLPLVWRWCGPSDAKLPVKERRARAGGFTCSVVANKHSRSLKESHPELKIGLRLRSREAAEDGSRRGIEGSGLFLC